MFVIMKKKPKILLAIVMLALLLLLLLPSSMITWLPASLREEMLSVLRPASYPTRSVTTPLPSADTLRISPSTSESAPTFLGNVLISVARFSQHEANRHRVKITSLNHLATNESYIFTVETKTNTMLVLSPKLDLLARWPMLNGPAGRMGKVVAISAQEDRIWALDVGGHLVSWDVEGNRKEALKLRGNGHDFDVFSGQSLVVHQTDFPFLLAIYNRRGSKLKQFARLQGAKTAPDRLLNQGYVAVQESHHIAFGMINPYRLYFFGYDGIPKRTVEVVPDFHIKPVRIESLPGDRTLLVRQRVIHDMAWNQDRLYVLIASEGYRAAKWMDVFSATGEFIHRVYLPIFGYRISFWHDEIIMLGYDTRYVLARFQLAEKTTNTHR